METCINEIIELEWQQFQKVNNEGGRASCQNDKTTFIIMRKSQFMAWNENVLNSYKKDLIQANENHWNLLTEKYARMMESTDYEQYKKLENTLPVRSLPRKQRQEKVIQQVVKWQEEFCAQYPYLGQNGRNIHTYEDTKYNTSFETYTRGELSTYSDETFNLYEEMINGFIQNHINLSMEIMLHEVQFYGYQTIEQANQRIKESI